MLEITPRCGGQSWSFSTPCEKTADRRGLEALDLHDRMREAREKLDATQKRFVLKNTTNYGTISMTACARLAKARNRAEIGTVSGYARRQIASLKAAARRDSDNAPRIKAVVAQLEKVVARAGKKKKDLAKEELTARRQARAEEELRRREALRLRAELQKHRAVRTVRERGYIREAMLDDWGQVQRAAAQEAARIKAGDVTPARYSGAVQQYLETAGPVTEPSGGVDVQV